MVDIVTNCLPCHFKECTFCWWLLNWSDELKAYKIRLDLVCSLVLFFVWRKTDPKRSTCLSRLIHFSNTHICHSIPLPSFINKIVPCCLLSSLLSFQRSPIWSDKYVCVYEINWYHKYRFIMIYWWLEKHFSIYRLLQMWTNYLIPWSIVDISVLLIDWPSNVVGNGHIEPVWPMNRLIWPSIGHNDPYWPKNQPIIHRI